MNRLLLSSLIAITCSGCLTTSTAEVHVRDARHVTLETTRGEPVLTETVGSGVVDRGELWWWGRYEITARRGSNGSIALHCDACSDGNLFFSLTRRIPLLDVTGHTSPTSSSSVDVGASSVTVSYEECVLYGKSFCHLDARAKLVIPASDVVEVRRRVEPVRLVGPFLLAMSALGLVGTFAVGYSGDPSGGAIAGWTAGAVGFAGIGALGLWHLLAPAREQVWTPADTLDH